MPKKAICPAQPLAYNYVHLSITPYPDHHIPVYNRSWILCPKSHYGATWNSPQKTRGVHSHCLSIVCGDENKKGQGYSKDYLVGNMCFHLSQLGGLWRGWGKKKATMEMRQSLGSWGGWIGGFFISFELNIYWVSPLVSISTLITLT